MRWIALGAAVAALVVSPATLSAPRAAKDEVTKISEEAGWGLWLDHTTDDGCYIAKATPAMTLRIQHDPTTSKIFVMIFNYRWKSLEEDKRYPLTFTFDKNPAWDVSATALNIGGAPGLMFTVADTEFIDEVSSSHFVTFVTGEKLVGSFDLSGSSRALTRLGTCMSEMDKAKDPFSSGSTKIPPPVVIPVKPQPKDDPFGT